MRIYSKSKTSLVFECGKRCKSESWLRFEIYDNGTHKSLEVDKASMCCDITLNQRNIDTLIDWLSVNKLTSIQFKRNKK